MGQSLVLLLQGYWRTGFAIDTLCSPYLAQINSRDFCRSRHFWEHAPQQALDFAKIRQQQYGRKRRPTAEEERRASEPLAVVACVIRLGFCFDLLEPENVRSLQGIFADYKEMMELTQNSLPKNTRKFRKLDCDVFEYAYRAIEESEQNIRVDTIRGVYVPTGGKRRIWDGSWISRDTHIQLCVRNPASLLGTWLHYPTELEVNDVCEALRIAVPDIGGKDSQGEAAP